MTVTVIATSTTQTKRREPLRVLDMATSQARARHASSTAPGGTGKGGGRRTRSSLDKQERNEEGVNGEKKRKAAIYDEDVEGFQFSRTTSKKQKSGTDVQKPVMPAMEVSAPQPSPRRGRPPKKRVEEKVENIMESKKLSTEGTGKRQTRGSAKKAPEPEPQPQPQPERSTRSARKRDHGEQAPVEKKRKKGRPNKSHEEQPNGFVSPEPPQAGMSTIALPLADTPVIQRNREMRGKKSSKGSRRSSLSMRGRRASSLIDSGASNALPHTKVDTAEFYKHIASDGLPEPRRMRQLLIWCATRAMGDKPSGSRSEDESARLAARVIQEELLKEFSGNSELSSWFAREDTTPPTVVVKKANPKNVQNQDKIKELEEQIQKLQKERHALNALLRPPSIPRLKPPPKQAPNGQSEDLPQLETAESPTPQPDDQIDLSVLDPSQQRILASLDLDAAKRYQNTQPNELASDIPTLPPVTPSSISTRLSRITSHLAPTIDSLAAGVHDIELYRSMSDAVSSRVLRICAERLEERDTRNVLRRLAITRHGDGDGEGKQKDVPLRLRPKEDLGPILGALSRVERR
ncbi:Mis12-Mtw1 family protein [Aspergillus lucknowensis]|uniref:Mis12-Mtw1 protein family-domain-containing protein n=1 Tax=Aspergillus lucknowensis TaxID=176173 RepID=A0ABR4LRV9_9EURO